MAKRLIYQAYDGFPKDDLLMYEMMRKMTPVERFEMCLKMTSRAIEVHQPNWENLNWFVLRKRIKE